MADLSRRNRELQLTRHLERFRLVDAKIKGIGDGKKATLRSYNIDNAADLVRSRIEAIPGFGSATAGLLLTWRSELERRFVFNPNQPINPSDIAQVKSDIARRRNSIEAALKADLLSMRTVVAEVQRSRADLSSRARPVWAELKQAEADESVRVFGDVSARRWVFAIGCVASFIAAGVATGDPPKVATTSTANISPKISSPTLPATPNSSASNTPKSTTPTQLPSIKPLSQTIPGQQPSPMVAPGSFAKETASSFPPPSSQTTISAQPSTSSQSASISALGRDASSVFLSPPPPSLPPLELGKEIKPIPQPPFEASLPPPQLQDDLASAARSIGRLRELGFVTSNDTTWNTTTRAALRDFKIANHLSSDSELDARTQLALSSAQPVARAQSFLGSWSTELNCSTGAQLNISVREARTEAGACTFDAFFLAGSVRLWCPSLIFVPAPFVFSRDRIYRCR